MIRNLLVSAAASVLFAASASATVYTHDVDKPKGSDKGGDITGFTVSYNDNEGHEALSGSFDIKKKKSKYFANTAWMVLSPGTNPKNSDKELAIVYMDFESGDAWVYEYNGKNNSDSYKTGKLLGHYENALKVTEKGKTRTVEFDFDVADIQDANDGIWSGVSFGKEIGVWFHAAKGRYYASDNGIRYYKRYSKHSWYDIGNIKTFYSVPEISGASSIPALALMFGLIALLRERRLRKVQH